MMKLYMIDLDGTMFRGTERIEGAKEWIDYCIQTHTPFLFLTNNSCRTQEQACQHMLERGFSGIKPEHFYTSAMAASDTIRRRYPALHRAFCIGEQGMRAALLANGFELVDKEAEAVFIGLDRHAGYEDYSRAIREIKNGALFIGTNNDRILLSEEGYNCGNGSVIAMLEYAADQTSIRIGKPYPAILEGALHYAHVKASDVILIGDNLETDILCGVRAGIETILVETGVHTRRDVEVYHIVPDHIIERLDQLIR